MPTSSFALDLGEFRVFSLLGEPLRAEIGIVFATRDEIETLRVGLAPEAAFQARDLPRSTLLEQLRFSVGESAGDGKPAIFISSKAPIEQQRLAFVIEARWSGSILQQEIGVTLHEEGGSGQFSIVERPAPVTANTEPAVSIEYELDPYYSNVGAYIPLTNKPMKEFRVDDEDLIYKDLLTSVFTPRFLLVEASINPLPVLGVYLKEEQETLFEQGEVSKDLNLIEALTEGFEEPYAISFFVGNVIRFTSPRSRIFRAVNKGYSGFLVSFGDQHIKNSELIDDDWYEFEWKLKGDRRIDDVYHSWSFRIGTKVHDNPDIADVTYLGIRRELFNEKPGNYAWYENTGIDYSVDFRRDSDEVVQHEIFVEKRWPGADFDFSLGVGVTRRFDKYTGALAEESDQTRLILRPGFSF